MPQDMCPICTQPFNLKDIVIKFWEWNESDNPSGPTWGHLDCVLSISRSEEREHPPQV